MLRITMRTEHDAFQPDARAETARILVELAERLESGEDFTFYRNLKDINGNVVGTCKLTNCDCKDAPHCEHYAR